MKTPKTNARIHASSSIYDVSYGTSVKADKWRARANSKPLKVTRLKR